MKLNIL